MEGQLLNFRGGKHTKSENQMILEVPGITTRQKATSLVGKTVSWKSPVGKVITGKITNVHGNKGVLRVQFEKGMPGQSIGAKVEVK
jgi:large subunit ribosomal protein L35Ae